mgnify:FL=1|jgi:hypothetical protein|tara:strand:+ start:85 stop:264 length:180 start_codon:yes stop_codon:yes gene_type:complete
MKKNWVYYMQEGLKAMWKKKEVPDYRREKNLAKLYNQEKVFKPIDYKECGCLPDCGCKE